MGIETYKPFEDKKLRSAGGQGSGAPPEKPGKSPNAPAQAEADKPIDPKKRIKERKVPGRKSRLEKIVSQSANKEGGKQLMFKPPAGLEKRAVEKLWMAKGVKQEKAVNDLIDSLRSIATDQLARLPDTVTVAGGTDKRSGRYGVALLVAKALQDNFTARKIGEALQKGGQKALIPYFVQWTWLASNGFALGDPKSYLTKTPSTDQNDAKKIKEREKLYEGYEKGIKPEMESQILDRIGEELDKIARWARAELHNKTVQARISGLRAKDPNAKIDPQNPQFRLVKNVEFPSRGLVAHLAETLQIAELKKESLLEKVGSLSYVPYSVTSQKRKTELAQIAKQKREAEPGRIQAKSKAQAERVQATIDRQAELNPLMDVAAQRRQKMEAISTALGKDLRGELNDLATRVSGLTTALKNFLEDAGNYMPPKDTRKWLDKKFVAKDVGELQATKLDGLKREAKELDTRWVRLQDFINNVVVAAIPKETRAVIKLDTIQLDSVDPKKAPAIVDALKKAFGEIRKKDKAPQNPAEQDQYLRRVLPAELKDLATKLETITGALQKAYKERDLLNKDPQSNALRLVALEKEIKAGVSQQQSLKSTVQNLKWLLNPKDPDVKMKIDPKQRQQRIKKAVNQYWGQGKR